MQIRYIRRLKHWSVSLWPCRIWKLTTIPGGGGGAHLYFAKKGVLPWGRVRFSRSWVLKRVYNFTIKWLLNRVSFWNGSLSKSVKTCDERCTFAIPISLYTKQNKSGSESSFSCLKEGSEISIFVLNRVRVWRPWRHPRTQTSLECLPPPPGNKHSIYLKILIMSRLSVFQCRICKFIQKKKTFYDLMSTILALYSSAQVRNAYWLAAIRPLLTLHINQSNQSINQLYLNTINGSASSFSDMPCDNYKV